jgi:hypothetical protein
LVLVAGARRHGHVVGDQALLDGPLEGNTDGGVHIADGPGTQARGGLASVEPVEVLGSELRESDAADLGYEVLAADPSIVCVGLGRNGILQGSFDHSSRYSPTVCLCESKECLAR